MKEAVMEIIGRDDYSAMGFKDLCYILSAHTPKEKGMLQQAVDELVHKEVIYVKNGKFYLKREKQAPGNDSMVRVGIFERSASFGFVRVGRNERDIYIPKKSAQSARNGDLVEVRILNRGENPLEKPRGIITRVIAGKKDRALPMKRLYCEYDLSDTFTREVKREAEDLLNIDIRGELEKRRNLCGERLYTIDSVSAKDLDDAVGIRKIPEGYKIFICIADVGFYVDKTVELDREAYTRGTSVYLTDRVIPMLPKELSENLCSLTPGSVKLCFTAEIDITQKGKVLNSAFYRSYMKSMAKLSYEELNRLYKGDENVEKVYLELKEDLFMLRDIAKTLNENRMTKGSIDLDIPEASIEVDKKGRAVSLGLRERGEGEKVIEELMLLANCSVAEYIFYMGIPSLYRVHEEPDMDDLREFRRILDLFGYRLHLESKNISGQLNDFLTKLKGSEKEFLIKQILLRMLKKAEYKNVCMPHFALNFGVYTHFTAPIRRYPDLAVHRILASIVNGKCDEKYISYLENNLGEVALNCSENEIRAQKAEREEFKLKCAQYMTKFRGKYFRGIIRSFMSFGFFVQLSNMAEGLVRFADIGSDFYETDESRLFAVGNTTGKRFTLSDEVYVKIASVNCDNGEIDLELVENGVPDEIEG